MEGLFWLLLSAAVFYLIMRFGFGARLVHGGQTTWIDPVCGMEVDPDQGYAKMYRGREYRFCARVCLDQFDAHPKRFLTEEEKGGEP
ncbi:YHS domain-containing protein [Methylocaldum sp. 14B]|uniref:YHS domain-containing protein n=1 Tax=Methylocaldum sp. 14B TaxID=1912213 RepID=UPI00098A23C7|nr:YHS domain-containing protein [Methylocaldum sp. 14B]